MHAHMYMHTHEKYEKEIFEKYHQILSRCGLYFLVLTVSNATQLLIQAQYSHVGVTLHIVGVLE